MRTKLEAARIAAAAGCATLIGSGEGEGALGRLLSGQARGTLISAEGSPAKAYKAWIAGMLAPAGAMLIDEGAAAALRKGGSLLPAGATGVEGSFGRGDCVAVLGPTGERLGQGLSRYDAEEARCLLGARGKDIAERLGYSRGDELIHRDDLVIE
jgi:glutamate 5-kinase